MSASEVAKAVKTFSVLIVDDLAEDRITFRRFLTRNVDDAFDVYEAVSVADARRVLGERHPDCVLLDYDLPDGNGLSLLRDIVSRFGRNVFGMVMLTASTGVPIAVEALQMGAHDFLQKSGSNALQLRQVVRNAIEKAAIQRELAQQREALAQKNREVEQQLHDLRREMAERRRAEAELRKSQEQLSAIFNQAGAGIVRYGLNGRISLVNDRFCEIAGRPRESLLALRVHDLTHPDDLAETERVFETIAKSNVTQIVEKRYVWPNGRIVWIRKSVAPILNEKGGVEYLLAVAEDITDSKRVAELLRESEAQLRLVADNAPVFLAHFDREYRFKFVNLAYATRFGMPRDSLIGRSIADITGQSAFQKAKPHIDAAFEGRRIEFEEELEYPQMGKRWMHVLFDPQRDSRREVTGVIAVVVDITDRKSNEHHLARTRDDAVAASRAKDDFLAALSHELRTPLNPVLLLASEAASNAALPPDVRADFETIRVNVELEARLIDDLLDLTRITRNKLTLQLQTVNVHQVLKDAITKVEADVALKHLRLVFDYQATRPMVRADPVRLQQVFWNVLKNAVKFTPIGGYISIATFNPDEEDLVCIRITDTGIGMSPEEIGAVFEAFSQGYHAQDNKGHRFGGLGLGLAISRSLVEIHGGKIRASSEGTNRGATFTIELPGAESRERDLLSTAASAGLTRFSSPDSRSSGIPVERARILLVEDHGPTRATLKKLLARRHFEVVAVESLAAGRNAAQSESFDVVISDIGLPDGDGCVLMSEIRARNPNQRGIALSGYGMDEDVQRTSAAGFALHLTKPVNVDALDRALSILLNQPAS